MKILSAGPVTGVEYYTWTAKKLRCPSPPAPSFSAGGECAGQGEGGRGSRSPLVRSAIFMGDTFFDSGDPAVACAWRCLARCLFCGAFHAVRPGIHAGCGWPLQRMGCRQRESASPRSHTPTSSSVNSRPSAREKGKHANGPQHGKSETTILVPVLSDRYVQRSSS